MVTIFLVCWPYIWYVDHISGILTIILVLWPYFWYVDHTSGISTIFLCMLFILLVWWPYFWYVGHISGMLAIFLVCWLYFLYVYLISGRLTILIWRISIAYFVLSQVYFVATLSFWKWGFFQILLKSLQILEILSGACLSFWIFDKADTMAKNDNWDQPTGIQGQTAL